jgi:hypothetical protein
VQADAKRQFQPVMTDRLKDDGLMPADLTATYRHYSSREKVLFQGHLKRDYLVVQHRENFTFLASPCSESRLFSE